MTETPTGRWLAASPLPPLDGPEGTAERLLLLVHFGVDWDSWIGDRRATYWDSLLPDRVAAASIRANQLGAWWSTLHRTLETSPRNAAQRHELGALLAADSWPVLHVLRTQSDALLLRTRITADAVRATRKATEE